MKIETEYLENIRIVKLYGELDASNAVQVDHTLGMLIAEKPSQIWIDGCQISYISSAGLGVFLSHLQTLTEEKIELLFFGLNTKIKHVFAILGLDTLIPILSNREEAETYLAGLPIVNLQEAPRKEA